MKAPEALRPRALVPTPREGGVPPEPPAPLPPAAAGERGAVRRAVTSGLRDLDPRAIAQGRPKLPLVVFALSGMVFGWYETAFGLLLPEMRADFAFDLEFLLALGGLAGAVALALSPVVGYLADRVRRVPLYRAGTIAHAASSLATGLAGSAGLLVAGRVGVAGSRALHDPVVFPILADRYPADARARVFGFVFATGYVGSVAGPIIGGNIGAAFGWRPALVSLGALALALSLLSFLVREPPRGREDRLASGADPDAPAPPPVGWRESWRAARSVTTVRRLWYATPFLEVAGAAVLVFLGLYYAEVFGLDTRARANILALSAAVSAAGVLLSGPVADRLLAHRPGRVMTLMGLLLTLQAAVLVVLAFSPSVALSIGVSLPLAFTSGLFAPALFTLVSLTVPARIRGLGLQTTAPWRIAGLLILPFVGALADRVGLRYALLVFVPLYLIAALILGTAASGVARDVRAVRAAAAAEEASIAARAAGRASLLVCRDVDVSYDGVQVLHGVDLDVAEGEIVALLGTNGAGKSTLLRAIAGLHEASNGAVFFDGRDVTHLPPHEIARAGAVLVPGGRAVFPSLTVQENLRAAGGDAEEALALFPALRARLGEQAGNLSGGEQQMLALAQAFGGRPRLLLIDELTLGLAPAIVEQLLATLRAIHERGTTIVLVEQSVNIALTIAGRAVFLEKGEVRFAGPTAELLGRGDLVRSVFLGGAGGAGRAAPAGVPPLLDASGLGVSFGGVRALDGASLAVRPGEIVGIIGPNGAGKSTLFDAVSGFVPLERGRVALEGEDVTALAPQARARLGLVRSFQDARLFRTMTVREAIAAAMERSLGGERALAAAVWSPGVRKLERRALRRADAIAELLGLGAYGERFVDELSTAMRRILDLACATAAEPRVLLLDEPSSGLAQAESEVLGPLLRRVVSETGCAMALIEHDVPLVTAVAHRMVAMDLGRVIAEGAPDDVVRHPDVVRAYLGGSEEAIARSGRAPR